MSDPGASSILELRDFPLLILYPAEAGITAETEAIPDYGYLPRDPRPSVLLASVRPTFRLPSEDQLAAEKDVSLRRQQ